MSSVSLGIAFSAAASGGCDSSGGTSAYSPSGGGSSATDAGMAEAAEVGTVSRSTFTVITLFSMGIVRVVVVVEAVLLCKTCSVPVTYALAYRRRV